MPTPIDCLTDLEAQAYAELHAEETATLHCGEGLGQALREACRFDLSRPEENLSALLALVS